MTKYTEMSIDQLSALKLELESSYLEFKKMDLKLDMSRGKPGPDQLDISMDILDLVNSYNGIKAEDGTDCRNYGVLDGIPECKALFASIFEVDPDEVIVGGNSSLNLMFDIISQAMVTGFGKEPWLLQGKVKFLCPSPGYDRHFSICEHFGIEMITVPMTPAGPDMDIIEKLVTDPLVKGMWCVPKYSNPDGITYSNEVVKRIAALKPAASDFLVMWDNAYNVHHLIKEDKLLPILEECKKAGTENQVIMFTSTSKITFPGAGISAMAASKANVALLKKRLTVQTIGPDKLNQLRHTRRFKNINDIEDHMKKHADILGPKLYAVLSALDNELEGLGIAEWNKPNGGYFVSLNTLPNCAKRVALLCKEAGMILTPAGATFPYGNDPQDQNIRIAPTFPPTRELEKAIQLFCITVKLAAVESLLQK